MLTQGEDVEVHALHQRGWSISAIARHLERDRKTVRAYVRGERQPGVRRRAGPDAIEPFVPYLRARFGDDPHLWLTALYDEVIALGYPRSYPTFVRSVRSHRLRPHCEPCHGVTGRLTIEIEHPPGEEIQWDWFERRRAPWGGTAYVLLGTLPHSGRVRGVLAESMDQPHLVEAMDAVLRRLGGTERPPPAPTEIATVAFRGNRYSVPHGLTGASLTLRHRLGGRDLEIHAPSGVLVAVHELRPAGGGALVRSEEHRAGLEAAVLSAFSSARPCERKGHHPPGPAARAAATVLTGAESREVVVDLARYAELAGTVR